MTRSACWSFVTLLAATCLVGAAAWRLEATPREEGPVQQTPSTAAQQRLPDLPQPVTSFGAAAVAGDVYLYGGHAGSAHKYSREGQSGTLWRLRLEPTPQWTPLAKGPRLQGLALVAHGGKLIRLGGFEARNREAEEQDLWSTDEVACFDPARKEWSTMPPLPEPRSSFDAVVLGDRVYVAGGWQLQGDGQTVWHRTAYVLDLAADEPRWNALPEPPFVRRALALAAHDGKLYVLGGMQQDGGPTTRVDVFDPASRTWSRCASLPGEPMDGFGCAAVAAGGRLYASVVSGHLLRLKPDQTAWEVVAELDRGRFFHRMLPVGSDHLLILGGANMSVGKFPEVDRVRLPATR